MTKLSKSAEKRKARILFKSQKAGLKKIEDFTPEQMKLYKKYYGWTLQ